MNLEGWAPLQGSAILKGTTSLNMVRVQIMKSPDFMEMDMCLDCCLIKH